MKKPSFATRCNADLIDQNYDIWLNNPDDLDSEWHAFFEGFILGREAPINPNIEKDRNSSFHKARLQAKASGAIYAYRNLGHTEATLDPLNNQIRKNPRLNLDRLGLSEDDFQEEVDTGNYLGGKLTKVGQLLDQLKKTYCRNIGVEYLHIQETEKRRWLQKRMEPHYNEPNYDTVKQVHILKKIIEAERFEGFLQTRFIGQKRFSLEGAETAIACIDAIIERCPELGIKEIVMGMAHRGRLNVLANIFRKSHQFIFNEFSENYLPETSHGSGDVKYHLGYDNLVKTTNGSEVLLHLAANPSHLEAVNPVVQGRTRALQRLSDDLPERKKVLPILVHGDAAIAGQGIVSETFNFSKLKGYQTGGTVHLVINNQIGFTTDPKDARSTLYCTAVGKMVDTPVFHVNGDDPLAVVYVTELALEYRQHFGEDAIVDMYCYRKHGHNESDEPAFTQPQLYEKIKAHPCVSKILGEKMIKDGLLAEGAIQKIKNEVNKKLQVAYDQSKELQNNKNVQKSFIESNAEFQPIYNFNPVKTAVNKKQLSKIAERILTTPESFTPNPKIKRQLTNKYKAFLNKKPLDWALGESLAFGTLLAEGINVRLSGQDCERGTFSHRHSTIRDIKTEEVYTPLNHIQEGQATYCVHNSLLSEAGVLGFEYGYSLDYKLMLGLWEAQFGDFANGAQVIFDQFIASSESKWGRISGLVMLLPHGYEGQGPEHSSARLERYLQACAENNIQVCNVTSPAQYFHLLRRQMHRIFTKPLIVMAPKSLLRHKACVSPIEDFTKGSFQEILDDVTDSSKVKRVIFCSGKIYYDLLEYRHENALLDTAIIRLEQLYPVNKRLLRKIIQRYKNASDMVWCQEEPQNMGAYYFINPYISQILQKDSLIYIGRKPSASPATGALKVHQREQAKIVKNAFSNQVSTLI